MAGELPPVVGELRLTISDFLAKIDEAREKLAAFADERAEATIGADTEEATADLDEVRAKVEDLDDAHADATVGAETVDADTKLEDIQGKVEELDASHADPTVGAETSEADAKIDDVQRRLAELEAERATAHVSANTGSSDSEIASLTGKMLSFGAIAPAVASMAGGAFAALPGILAGASAGFGALFMGLDNVIAAISAYRSVTASAAQIGNEMAQEQVSNAQSLANAAEQIASAQIQLSQAEVQAYDSVHQAQEQVVQSAQQLVMAQQQARMAQTSLTEAEMNAKFQLQDYQNQLASMALQITQAQTSIQQAKLSLDETLGDPAATELQKEQATNAYNQAKQQLVTLQTQYQQLQQEAAYQSAKGVTGADQVVAAQSQVTQSQYQIQNAQQQAADAAMYLKQAQVSSAQETTQAQMQLNQALQNQQFTLEQIALTMAQPIGAMGQLQQAMAMLGPAGQQFVNWWHSNMTPLFTEMEQSDQAALLPGLQSVMTTLVPYFQALIPIIDAAAQGFDTFAMSAATFLSSAKGISELQATMASGLGFMKDIGTAIVTVMKALGNLGVIAAPAVAALGHAIDLVAQGFLKWTQSAGAKELISTFTQLLGVVENVVHAMGGFGALAGLLALIKGPLFLLVAFIPQLMPLAVPFVKLAGALGEVVKHAASPVITQLVTVLLQMMTAVSPLIPVVGQLVSAMGAGLVATARAALPVVQELARLLAGPVGHALVATMKALAPLTPVLVGVMGAVKVVSGAFGIVSGIVGFATTAFEAVGGVLTFLAANPIVLIGAAIAALGVGIYELVTHWNAVWSAVKSVTMDAWHFLDGLLHNKFVQILLAPVAPLLVLAMHWRTVWTGIQSVVRGVWDFLRPIFDAIGRGITDLSHALGTITHAGGGILGAVAGGIGSALHVIGLAEGGLVTQPTLAVVGESGPEMVLPMNRLGANVDRSGVSPLPGGGAGAPGGTVVNNYVTAATNADPHEIANEIGWAMRNTTGGIAGFG